MTWRSNQAGIWVLLRPRAQAVFFLFSLPQMFYSAWESEMGACAGGRIPSIQKNLKGNYALKLHLLSTLLLPWQLCVRRLYLAVDHYRAFHASQQR